MTIGETKLGFVPAEGEQNYKLTFHIDGADGAQEYTLLDKRTGLTRAIHDGDTYESPQPRAMQHTASPSSATARKPPLTSADSKSRPTCVATSPSRTSLTNPPKPRLRRRR